MNKRGLSRAFRAAAAVWFTAAVACALILLVRWRWVSADPINRVSVVAALTAIVFLTYFVLGLAGYRISPDGVARVPRVVAWLAVACITIVVFGIVFYFLIDW